MAKISQQVHDYVRERMTEYGKFTLQERAIPELKDGLKPVYRRLIWAAYVDGYVNNSTTKKSARLVGSVIGKYHPQGDSAVYGALVTLCNNPNSFFVAQGNFGCKATDDEEAAYRYTEAKLSKIAEKYLLDKDYIAVTPMVPNYDGSEIEPVYLPAKLPFILLQGIEGIATGAATNIPSFSLESVKNLVIEAIKKKKCTPQMCLDYLKFHFSEGGKVCSSKQELLDFYAKGEGRIYIVPTLMYDKKSHSIVVSSYCPRFKLNKLFAAALDIEGVSDVEDLSQLNRKTGERSVRIILKLKKSFDEKKAARNILKVVGTYMPYSLMITDRKEDGKDTSFRYTTIPDIIMSWIDWRLSFEIPVVKRLISIEEEKIQKYDWLLWAVMNRDLVHKSWDTKSPDEMLTFLCKKGKITKEHAEFVGEMRSKRFTNLSKKELKDKKKESEQIIKLLKRDIKNKDSVSKRVIRELESIKD